MAKGKAIYVSKLDAAIRQLEQAIKMFFSYGEIVSIHALTCNAGEILADMGDKQDIISIFRDFTTIREDKREELKKIMRKPQNFFKHSNRKGQEKETLEFIPVITEFHLYDACELYEKLSGERRTLTSLFRIWFYLNHPGILSDKVREEKILKIARGLNLNPGDRTPFLNILPELIQNEGKNF